MNTGSTDQICWLLYTVMLNPLPECPCIRCYKGSKDRCNVSVCYSYHRYQKVTSVYSRTGILAIAENISSYRRNILKIQELELEIQKLSEKNTSILRSLPKNLADAVCNGVRDVPLAEDIEIDALLKSVVKKPLQSNPCVGCPFIYTMECYSCKRSATYDKEIKPYKSAGILGSAACVSMYHNNSAQITDLKKNVETLSYENKCLLNSFPSGLHSMLNRGKVLEAARTSHK